MATRKVLLKEDRTGLFPDNFIENEIIDSGVGRDRLVVLEYGAFFSEGLVIVDEDDIVIDRSHYMFTDLYEEATRLSGKEVWNCIIIKDQNVPKKLKASYHAFGGKFAANGRLLIEWLNELLNESIEPIEWVDILDKQKEFVPKFHMHLWREVYGFSFIKEPLTRLENAIKMDSSPMFDILIRDIKRKLKDAEEKASELAKFYASDAVYRATKDISKETMNLHLLANLSIASPLEMRRIANSTFNSSTILEDKYINKKGLIAFTEVLKNRSVSIEETGLGTDVINIKPAKKGSLLSLGNSGVITIESKKDIVLSNNYYEENVYPKEYPDDARFTVIRVTNNIEDHGGLFLGFNNNTGEMYSGVLKSDRCYNRIRWYKFYSELTYDKILDALNEHRKLTNNPHRLTKEQVMLEKVVNMPVVTIDQIMGEEPADAYITLDTLSAFMTKHLLNLKGEFKEDGSLDKDSDLFNKPNLIFTPCDKKVPHNWPPKGQMLNVYCNGTDRFKRLADGEGGWTDELVELNSDDCKYFEIKPQGEVLHSYCDGFNKMSVVADGRGKTTVILSEVNSKDCGYVDHPPAGTVLFEGCEGFDLIRRFADGSGGIVVTTIESNSEQCGYVGPPPPGTILSEGCNGTNFVRRYANGTGGSVECVIEIDSLLCGAVVYPDAGTILFEGCEGTDLIRRYADGNGGSTDSVVEYNSPQCGGTVNPPPGTVLFEGCEGVNFIRSVADGNGGVIKNTIRANDPECGGTVNRALACSSTMRELALGDTETYTVIATGYPPNTTVQIELQAKCTSQQLSAVGLDFTQWQQMKIATINIDSSGRGTWTLTQTHNATYIPVPSTWDNRAFDTAYNVGSTPYQRYFVPVVNRALACSSTMRELALGDTETYTVIATGYPPNTTVQIELQAKCTSQQLSAVGLDFTQWQQMKIATINIDSSGRGTWTLTQTHNATYIPVPSTWDNRAFDTAYNVGSTPYQRYFVPAGQ